MWSEEDNLECLLRVYFGDQDDKLGLCISRAYLDMSRTMHGFAKLEAREVVHQKAVKTLREALIQLRDGTYPVKSQNDFDRWHQAVRQSLIDVHASGGYRKFSVGQAQKWINMTLKYLYMFGDKRAPGFSGFFPYCHVPVDNIVLAALVTYGFDGLSCPWSRLKDHNEYFSCQEWIRNRFEDAPLDMEFALWMGKPVKIKGVQ